MQHSFPLYAALLLPFMLHSFSLYAALLLPFMKHSFSLYQQTSLLVHRQTTKEVYHWVTPVRFKRTTFRTGI